MGRLGTMYSTTLFIIVMLKITNQITWPWIAVLSPVWVLLIYCIVAFVSIVLTTVASIEAKRINNPKED